MSFEDYQVILYRQQDGSWVAEIPAISGCYALMDSRDQVLDELERVLDMLRAEYAGRGIALPGPVTATDLGSVS